MEYRKYQFLTQPALTLPAFYFVHFLPLPLANMPGKISSEPQLSQNITLVRVSTQLVRAS